MTDLTPGPRDELLTEQLAAALATLDPSRVEHDALDGAEGPRRVLQHLVRVLQPHLRGLGTDQGGAAAQAKLVNVLQDGRSDPDDRLVIPPQVVRAIKAEPVGLEEPAPVPLPETAFSTSDLLVGGVGQPNIGNEVNAELRTATSADLICAFVIWSGVTRLRDAIKDLHDRGGQLRVITTTYMGATEARAVEELRRLGADIRIAYDARTTKLHAKAWLLQRPAGLTTAFVGSSNLSHTALFDGLEWNVRLSAVDVPHLIARVKTMFDTLWESEHFESYREGDEDRLATALGGQRKRDTQVSFVGLEVRPFDEQQRILDRLMLERLRHDRHRNLVVAATGTGKTVVAGLDYKQLCKHYGRDLSLLFVAHRDAILEQSRETFRHVLRDGSFGELHGGGRRATGRHVFAMVQSLRADTIDVLDPKAYDVVIVDEFHHAEAPSYRRLLERSQPKQLLGLTATPERMDGADVTAWFGGRIAYELRLWEAIDEGFLVPFQYFGIADDVDLQQLTWRRAGYDVAELSNVYTAEPLRVAKVLQAIQRVHPDPDGMRALGFCVSVEHARFMAKRFAAAGVPAVAIDGTTAPAERRLVLNDLERGQLRAVFSVDVLGEGVDVPSVDTVLLLRPTDSATVFTQQLGRGLRRAEGKRYLTVIDLIGQQHREFRFDRRLRPLVDLRRGSVREQVEEGFPFLPAGCHIQLDRQSREVVLENLRQAAKLSTWTSLLGDARELGDVSLLDFLDKTDREVGQVYRGTDASWTRLRRDAQLPVPVPADAREERTLLRAVRRLQYADDPERTAFFAEALAGSAPPDVTRISERHRRLLYMLHLSLWGQRSSFPSLQAGLAALWPHSAVRHELVELLGVLDARSETLTAPSFLSPDVPLLTHACYSRDEVLGAFDLGSTASPPQLREGVKWISDANTDVFFVTLHKSERQYSATTMYQDYAMSRDLFHWESQATQSAGSESIRRYESGDGDVLLFVRERKETRNGVTAPYQFVGPVDYVSSSGSRPVAFTWRLRTPLPEDTFEVARAVAAAA
jgi:superfamily II DNA or RNA helicase/HKD family nuclease